MPEVMEVLEKQHKKKKCDPVAWVVDLYEDPAGEREPEEGEGLTEMDKSVRSMLLLMMGL